MSESRDKIIEHFIDDVSMEGAFPKSVYAFCKAHDITESEFYEHFSSFKSIENAVWSDLYKQVISVVESDDVYQEYNTRERYLAYCFTLIEHLKKRLSFYQISAGNYDLRNALNSPVVKVQSVTKEYFADLVNHGFQTEEIKTPGLLQKPVIKLFQMHNLFIFNYFLKDESEGFTDTDQAIEKSVRLLFDAIENSLLDSAIDFTKFMGKSVFA